VESTSCQIGCIGYVPRGQQTSARCRPPSLETEDAPSRPGRPLPVPDILLPATPSHESRDAHSTSAKNNTLTPSNRLSAQLTLELEPTAPPWQCNWHDLPPGAAHLITAGPNTGPGFFPHFRYTGTQEHWLLLSKRFRALPASAHFPCLPCWFALLAIHSPVRKESAMRRHYRPHAPSATGAVTSTQIWLPPRILPPLPESTPQFAATSAAPQLLRSTLPHHSSSEVAARCRIKGCIFPAAPHTNGRCLHHYRQENEPTLFHSHQPTLLILEHAKFELPLTHTKDFRRSDQRRLAALREAFLLEEAI